MPSTRRRFLAALGSAAGASALAGCVRTGTPDTSGTWPRRGLTNGHVGSADVDGPTGSLYPAWRSDLGDGIGHVTPTSPVVSDGVVYVAYGRNGGVTSHDCGAWLDAYDAATGERTLTAALWRQSDVGNNPISDSVVLDGDALFVQTLGGLVRVGKDGTVRWTLDNAADRGTDDPVPPVVTDGLVVAATYGYRDDGGSVVRAVERESGDRRWRRNVEESVPWALAAADGVLYVPAGSGDARLVALDIATGERRWTWNGRVAGSPTVADGAVYVPLHTNWPADAVAALDADTHELRWHERVGKRLPQAGLAVADGRVYHAAGRGLEARDASDGARVWRFGGDDGGPQVRPDATPVVSDGTVYVTGWAQRDTTYGHVFAVDAATGDARGRVSLGRNASARDTVPALTDGRGYVATDKGRAVAFGECETSLFGRCLVG